MIRRFVFGEPLETEAVLQKPPAQAGTALRFRKEGTTLTCPLEKEDAVYGLGEQVRGINKRGWIYESNCSDEPFHMEEKRSLYGAHNFLVVSGRQTFGVFLDTPGKVTFDIGYTKQDRMELKTEEEAFELYEIEGTGAEDVVRQFRELIGQSYIPPKWAFGFGQSRWSYRTAEEVREVVKNYRRRHIPLDMVYLDIDYMERYKDFTVDEKAFPDFSGFVREMKEQGVRLIPIIDAGIKKEAGYEVYEEGVKNDYFCKGEDGEDFVAGVWPGKCHFPDVLREDVRRWFGGNYRFLLDQGVEGFWNDMNEPAIFYSEKRLAKIFADVEAYKEMELDVDTFFAFQELTRTIANNPQDYRSFYHNCGGRKIRHDRVHNLFGYYMTRAASEAFEKLRPNQRILLFSRASYIGMHRCAGIWTGDNKSWWSHLLLNLKMMPSLNMCGFLYAGADIGGFGADTTQELMLRWLALGIFFPLLRNHSARGTRRQELYAFEETAAFRGILRLRYRLIPYLYSEYLKAALENKLYAKPLGFEWPDDHIARETEDQMLIGESIMIAPVYEQNASGRVVYLPQQMKLLRFCGGEPTEETVLPAGHHYIPVAQDEVVLFVRKGKILPLAQPAETVDGVNWKELTLFSYAASADGYQLYDDDGTPRAAVGYTTLYASGDDGII